MSGLASERALAYQSEGILVTFEITAVRGKRERGEEKGRRVILIGIRGHVHMMSALGGGRGVPQKQTTVLISCVSVTVTRGEGG